MGRYYHRFLGPTLREKLDEMTSDAPSEQLALYDELALIRDFAGQSVALYSAALSTGKQETIAAAGMLMVEQLQTVIKTCESAARIESMAKDKISIHTLHMFVMQVLQCANDAFGDSDPEGLRMFRELIDTRVKVPSVAEAGGTDLTPDVIDMDDTVPRKTDDSTTTA